MDFAERQKRIVERLRSKPIHHGQLEASLIAISPSESQSLDPERWQLLKDSLEQQGSNLVPLIVRRTEAYEEEEYEVVYGADWCIVAKELDIQRLWVWVFDMTDDEAAAAKEEMEMLLGSTVAIPVASDQVKQFESSLQRFEISLVKKINQQISESVAQVQDVLPKQLEPIQRELDQLKNSIVYVSMTVPQLKEIAKTKKIPKYSSMKKAQLIEALSGVKLG